MVNVAVVWRYVVSGCVMKPSNQDDYRKEAARLLEAERAANAAALQSLREYRRARIANRQLPCQPRAA